MLAEDSEEAEASPVHVVSLPASDWTDDVGSIKLYILWVFFRMTMQER